VNATPPISGTGSPQSAAHALPADSSLANFLLAGSPADAGQDFRTIAAKLSSVEASITSPSPSPANGSIAGKKPVADLPQDKPEARKDKQISDPASVAAQPELTVPLLNVPEPLVEAASKSEAKTGTLGLPDVSTQLEGSALFAGLTQTKSGDNLAADAVSHQRPALSETPWTVTPLSLFKEPDIKGPAAIDGDRGKELPSAPGDSAPLIQPPAIEDRVKQGKQTAARIAPVPTTGTLAKSAADRYQKPGVTEPAVTESARQVSTQTTNTNEPTLPRDVGVAARPSEQPPPASDSVPLASTLEQTSVASTGEIPDGSMGAKAVPQSGSVKPGLTADPKRVSGRTPENAVPKIKDRGNKDTRIAAAQSGKLVHAQAGNIAEGVTKSTATSSKDVPGLALPTHSGGNGKAAPLKTSAGTPSSSMALAETDAPDESLPTSTSSPVTAAKLVQGMSHSEFRIGMQSQEFGSIDIRTSVARHMFSAQISVEHSDVAKSMTADLPALYHRLADQQVPVANIVIHGQSLATSSGLAQDAQRQTWRPQGYSAAKSNAEPVLPVMTEGLDSGGRLDIRI